MNFMTCLISLIVGVLVGALLIYGDMRSMVLDAQCYADTAIQVANDKDHIINDLRSDIAAYELDNKELKQQLDELVRSGRYAE